MICKTVLQSVGGYDESFRFAQDYKLIYDLYSSQYSIKYLHEPLYCTGMSESSIGFTHSEAQRECANRVQQMFRSGKFKSASF